MSRFSGPSTQLDANGEDNTVASGSGWHKIEVYQKASTSCTSRDGVIKIWVDDKLTHNYTTVNHNTDGFRDVQINHTWDGSVPCSAGPRDCSNDWHHYFDHLYISAEGGNVQPGDTVAPEAPKHLQVR